MLSSASVHRLGWFPAIRLRKVKIEKKSRLFYFSLVSVSSYVGVQVVLRFSKKNVISSSAQTHTSVQQAGNLINGLS